MWKLLLLVALPTPHLSCVLSKEEENWFPKVVMPPIEASFYSTLVHKWFFIIFFNQLSFYRMHWRPNWPGLCDRWIQESWRREFWGREAVCHWNYRFLDDFPQSRSSGAAPVFHAGPHRVYPEKLQLSQRHEKSRGPHEIHGKGLYDWAGPETHVWEKFYPRRRGQAPFHKGAQSSHRVHWRTGSGWRLRVGQ